MDSGVWNSLFPKTLNWNSIERDCHAGLFGAPPFYRLTLTDNRDILNFPLQLAQLITEGLTQVFTSIGNHLLEKTASMQTVAKELAGDGAAQAATMTITVVQRWCHGLIVFLAG